MDDDFRKAALEYHRWPRPGKLQIEPTKRMATQRDLALAYSPGVAAACEEIARDPANRPRVYRAWQPRRGHLEWHRGTGSRQYRGTGRQTGDGGQGRPVQEVRRHRRVRYRSRSAGSGKVLRRGGGPRADLWRDQPRGHQGTGVLRHRGEPARANEDPGVPRRPARHRYHGGRRGAQRAGTAGQEAGRHQARYVRRRGRRHGVRGFAGGHGSEGRERDADRHQGRRASRPGKHRSPHGPLRARYRSPHAARYAGTGRICSWAFRHRGC